MNGTRRFLEKTARWRCLPAIVIWAVAAGPAASDAAGSELWIGAATGDITPDRPVPLTGYRSVRVSQSILSRCTANVLALEARDGDQVGDQAILVACDLCVIRPGIQEGFRKHVEGRLPGFDIQKLFLASTHTHTAPVLLQDRYQGYGDAMQPKDYVPFLYERMADAVVEAWESRAVGAVAWGLGHAVVGCNRRSVFRDGSAVMYGKTNTPEFRGIEGYEDHAVDVLCFYDDQKKLKAAAITLACPAQSVRGSSLSADFWHDVRRLLRERHGEGLCVLGFAAPAGDQSPHRLFRQASEARMDKLRGLTQTQELGRRIAAAVDDVVGLIEKDIRTDVPLVHRIERFDVPGRKVTEEEYARAKGLYDPLATKEKLVGPDYWNMNFYKLTTDRYDAQQKADPRYPIEMHVLRLGDVAIATNPFELYLDYGVQIQARSPAVQTTLIQLASPLDFGYYVPTPKALAGGGYSAIVEQSLVGPEGGQALVERTLATIEELWK
ncbi:MAG TPA: hypothetical protein VMY37_00800 [Thermoguttaceae bacterium]|nr:hypothetical protein [Thermoguttaceae bacterium]